MAMKIGNLDNPAPSSMAGQIFRSTGGTAAPIDVNHHHGVNLTASNVTFSQVAATGSVE